MVSSLEVNIPIYLSVIMLI